MKSSEKEKFARGLFITMNNRDFSDIENLLDENVCLDFPGVKRTEGIRKTRILLNALLRKYPELEFSVQDVIIDEDRACVVWTNKGLDVNSSPYENNGITLLNFKAGKISFISDYFKDTSFTLGS